MTKNFQPITKIWCFIVCYILCYHSRRCYKCLFSTFSWDSSSSYQINITWSWFSTIKASRKIRIWRAKTARSSISHCLVSKIIPNLPIWWKYLKLMGIMVNNGWIHRELRKFMMISLNLIKSDYELMLEIRENAKLWKITSRRFHRIKNHRIWLWFHREIEDRSGR